MRRLRWIGAWLIGTALVFCATPAAPRETAAPLLALWEHAAGTSIETASPLLVIYQDGRVIAQRERRVSETRGGGAEFVTTQLELAQVNIWYDDIFTIAREEDLKGKYAIGGRDAARAATFYFQSGAHGLLVTVDGLSPRALSPFGALLDPPAEEVPARLLRIYQDARRIKLDRAAGWSPEWYEARFRPLTASIATPRPWPAEWPAPTASAEGGAAIMALPAAQRASHRELVNADAGWQPVAVGNGTLEVAFRPVLPNEHSWRRHIAADVEALRAAQSAASRTELGAQRDRVRTELQERVAGAGKPPAGVQPIAEPMVLPSPVLDRPTPQLSPLPPTPDPPNPKSKKSR